MASWTLGLRVHSAWQLEMLRCPSPVKDPTEFKHYAWELGFSCVIVMDLQRVFACLEVAEPSQAAWDLEYLAAVANQSSSFSNKLVTPMSTQQEWRQEGLRFPDDFQINFK